MTLPATQTPKTVFCWWLVSGVIPGGMVKLLDVQRIRWLARLCLFLLMLYVFLTAIELLGHSMKVLGAETAERLFRHLENPFAGLAVGILATALVQSSSLTTSMIVTAVGFGRLPLESAVPIVMGANIGTSITNTVVSLGHVHRDSAFRRAFAGATVHDLFNLLTVLILFPLQVSTGFLQHWAEWLTGFLQDCAGKLAGMTSGLGGLPPNPIKEAVKWPVKAIESFLQDALGLQGRLLAGVLAVLALCMVFAALVVITKNMRLLMADQIEQWLNRVLRRSGLLGLVIGIVITALVQSSSITTSLLVPMFGAGVLAVEAGFPIMVGANIGTTITALLAAVVAGPVGLTIALVHLLFNALGTLIFFPFKPLRRIPIILAEKLADLAIRNRIWILVYILGVFFVAPILGILIWK